MRLLVIDDDEGMRRSLARVLTGAGYECATAGSTAEARGVLGTDAVDLLICDVRMPDESGLDLIATLHHEPESPPVLMISGEDDPLVAEVAIEHGAYGYLVKPFDNRELLINVSNALHRRRLEERERNHRANLELAVTERSRELAETVARLERSRHELHRSRQETIHRLSRAVELRDAETGGHIERIGENSALLAERLGIEPPTVSLLRAASPMHDVGKIGIPDEILLKPGRLTPGERTTMEQHATIGWRILSGSDSDLLNLAASIALTHHERFDGSGYPRGLQGDGIPIEGRLVAVADVFDALTHDRVYRPAYSLDEAVEIMRLGRGTHFDPQVLDVLLDSVEDYTDRPVPSQLPRIGDGQPRTEAARSAPVMGGDRSNGTPWGPQAATSI
jgi:putative two-component system response regulator